MRADTEPGSRPEREKGCIRYTLYSRIEYTEYENINERRQLDVVVEQAPVAPWRADEMERKVAHAHAGGALAARGQEWLCAGRTFFGVDIPFPPETGIFITQPINLQSSRVRAQKSWGRATHGSL